VQVANLFDTAQVIALVGGVVIPFLVALLAKQTASGGADSKLAAATANVGIGTNQRKP
jgi:hypothetical protein